MATTYPVFSLCSSKILFADLEIGDSPEVQSSKDNRMNLFGFQIGTGDEKRQF